VTVDPCGRSATGFFMPEPALEKETLKMATAAQITANQVNAQSSTGPRTEAGKLAVSRNATTHGLAAKKFFLREDEKPLFDQLHDALVDHYQPATEHERALLEELAEAKWRCRLARSMEASFFEIMTKEQRKADTSLSEEHALARIFTDETLQKRMRLMMRYITTAERSADKARIELEHVIALRHEQERRAAEREAMVRRARRIAEIDASMAESPKSPAPSVVQNKPSAPLLR
jgi:hypothetical protein